MAAGRGHSGRNGLLLCAACRGNVERCRALLREGASVNCQDEAGLTPLMMATLKNHVDIVKLLLAHGCDLDLTSDLGRTALHLAVWNKRVTAAGLLLRAGCCANRQDSFLDTPLMLATWRGYTGLVKAILRTTCCHAHVTCDMHAMGPERDTALHYAARHGRSGCARTLHRAGAQLERRNMWGLTPLHLAVSHGNASTGLALLRLGADVNAADQIHDSVLHVAVRRNMPEVVLELLLRGAAREATDAHGNRPLVASILHADPDVTALLVRARCDLNATGTCGVASGLHRRSTRCSPLEVAVHRNRLRVAQLLVQSGCDVTGLRRSVRAGSLADRMAADGDFREWVTCTFHTPQTLANHCRRTLVTHMRTLPLSRVRRTLGAVPPGLVDYMDYGDLLRTGVPTSAHTVCHVSQMHIIVRS